MSLGKNKNVSSANKASDNAVKAVKPQAYRDQYGYLSPGGNYEMYQTDSQKNTRDTSLNKIDELVSGIPTQLSADDLFNNDFYGSLNDMYRRSIDSQYGQDKKAFDNQMNARNQIGSSYEAYSKNLMDKDYGSRYQNAESQARLGAADAWTQAFQNQLSGIGALRGDAMNAQNMAYQPLQMAISRQSSASPLQQAAAGVYNNQASQYWAKPTLWDNAMKYYSANAQAAGQAAGAMAGGA